MSMLKIVIIVLSVLLLSSAGGLAARYVYLQYFSPTQTTTTVPDNLIGDNVPTAESSTPAENTPPAESEQDTEQTDAAESGSASGSNGTGTTAGNPSDNENSVPAADKPTAPVPELYAGRPDVNQRFEVSNMLPGDTETRYFCVRAYHEEDITLFFRAEVTEQTKNLGDVLHIKVTHLDTGKVLCDAAFNEIDGEEFSELLKADAREETTAYYQIDVSLDTSVGNEYQAALLKADFEWCVKDEGGLVEPPQTGDTTNFVLRTVLAVSSLLLMIFLWKRRKEEEKHA